MTIGQKIKFCREKRRVTQAQLAERSGIHPVSIRKYETNRMIPQPEQLRRIANALEISPVSLLGVRDTGLQLNTTGDFVGVLMSLYEAGILQMTGQRDSSLQLQPDTYQLRLNPLLDTCLELETDEHQTIPLHNLTIKLKDSAILEQFLLWDASHVLLQQSMLQKDGTPDQMDEDFMRHFLEVELLLQLDKLKLSSLDQNPV